MKPQDVEKAHSSPSIGSSSNFELDKSASNSSSNDTDLAKPEPVPQSRCQRFITSLKNVESRGIGPIPIEEREEITTSTTLHMLLMWFSMTLATNNIVVGSMGTLVLGLSFRDAALCAVFGCLVGNCTVGYMSTWGPRSGNRTLVCLHSISPDTETYACHKDKVPLIDPVLMYLVDRDPVFHGLLPQQSVHYT